MTPDDPSLPAPSPGDDAARDERLQQWRTFLTSAPAPEPPLGLADRTLAAISRDTLPAAPAEKPYRISNWPRRLREYAAIAVAAGILVAVLVPGISQARQSSRRVACAGNLAAYSTAFANYASANAGLLPVFFTPPNHNWLGYGAVGPRAGQYSNADNLLPLLANAYITSDRLACPGRGTPDAPFTPPAPPFAATMHTASIPDGFRGYSYTALAANARTHWDGSPDTLVLADRNPLFDPRASDPAPADNSLNHNGKGTYLLAADGSVAWDTNPNVGIRHDNIWTLGGPQSVKLAYAGVETSTPDDAFLAP